MFLAHTRNLTRDEHCSHIQADIIVQGTSLCIFQIKTLMQQNDIRTSVWNDETRIRLRLETEKYEYFNLLQVECFCRIGLFKLNISS